MTRLIPRTGMLLAILALMLPSHGQVAQTHTIKSIALYPVIPKPTLTDLPVSATFHASIPAVPKPIPSAPGISLPLEEYRITSPFGWRKHPITGMPDFHNGIDLAARGQAVRNIMDGTVAETGYHRNLGNFVRIDHGDVLSVYGHLSRIIVVPGQQLTAGYPIGRTGRSGRATGEHLHFSIHAGGTYINPWKFLHGLIQQIDNEH